MEKRNANQNASAPPPPTLGIRKCIRDLTADEKQNFIDGCLALKGELNPTYGNTYDKYTYWHTISQSLRVAHKTPAFLPWHRYFILCFENDMRRILGPDKNFSLPYWDWEWDSRQPDPTTAPIWQNDFLGPTGYPVTSGPFKDTSWAPDINRELGLDIDSLPLVADVNAALVATPYDVKRYSTSAPAGFRNTIEGFISLQTGRVPGLELHNRLHNWVGGTMAMLDTAPNDPVFFLHHCNVDRIWATWQNWHPGELDPNQTTYPTNAKTGTNLTDQLYPWNDPLVTPSAFLDYRKYYRYKLNELYCGFNRGDGCIYIMSSTDGVNWGEAKNPTNIGSYNTPALIEYSDSLYCVWKSGGDQALFCASFDGTNWSAPIHLSSLNNKLNGSPSAAVFQNTLYSGWSYNGCVYITWYRSTDKRSSSIQPPNAGTDQTPALATFSKDNNNKLFCAYAHNDGCIYTIESEDGNTWSNPLQPTNVGSYISPALAEYNGEMYMAYTHNDGLVYVVHSSDLIAWSDRRNPPNAGSSKAPSLTSCNGLLFLAYTDNNGNFCNVTYNGQDWTNGTYTSTSISDFPAIARASILI